jgi:hypothetical protein
MDTLSFSGGSGDNTYHIASDNGGHVWVSTSNGAKKIDPIELKV